MNSRSGKKGFTLIELLVVISIIALLVSILLPALNQAREKGKAIVCLTNLKGMTLANHLHANDYKFYSPGDWVQNKEFLQLIEMPSEQIAENLKAYCSEATIPQGLQCPTSPQGRWGPNECRLKGAWTLSSYGYNIGGIFSPYTYHGIYKPSVELLNLGAQDEKFFKPSSIGNPSEKLMFIDCNEFSVNTHNNGEYYQNEKCHINYEIAWDRYGEMAAKEALLFAAVMYRHGEGANIAFYDGHAARLTKTEIWYLSETAGTDENGAKSFTSLSINSQMNTLWRLPK